LADADIENQRKYSSLGHWIVTFGGSTIVESEKILAVIPARGGSKGIPNKNMRLLAGKPLVQHTIEFCQSCGLFDKIVVSTDSVEIADLSASLGLPVPFMRSSVLATDDALSVDVVIDAHNRIVEQSPSLCFDYVALLQPTSPFRKLDSFAEAIAILQSDSSLDGVVSVCDVGGDHPFRMKRIVGNRLINFVDQGFEDMRPRQVLPKVYIRNGSLYLIKTSVLIKARSLVGEVTGAVCMGEKESINIDNELDFRLAELVSQEGEKGLI
jgi:CMP-N,N'-diacetyllegionaminic acid synthase